MQVHVETATGRVLDWMVALSEERIAASDLEIPCAGRCYDDRGQGCDVPFSPSTDAAQGAPIVDGKNISTTIDDSGVWIAFDSYNYSGAHEHMVAGATRLEAGLRCCVIKRLGRRVEVPDAIVARQAQ